MSAENVQVLRDGYAAFARQDIPAVMAAFDETIEWNVPDSLPIGGTYRGHDGVGAFFRELPNRWQQIAIEPEEFVDGGDTIVVVARLRATGPGGSLDQKVIHLWRMMDGRATSFTEYSDTARALQALGEPVTAMA
jgi:ketosteroid isomerase-like protein